MDSAYARLLQQQQLFLQLQILSQQKHQQQNHSHQSQCPQSQSFSYQPIHQHLSNKWVLHMYIYIYNFKFQIWSGYSKFSPIIMDETLSDFCLTVGISFRQTSEQQTPCSSSAATSTENSNSSSPVKTTYCSTSNMTPVRPGPLPANLDDLKVLNALIWRHFTQLYVQYLHRVKL